ncbi:MAG: molybdenum cofactor guanylyltransferase [Archaeoglobus sp.]|nr:molybdenum cofactor guanylyltransferase [Archaeoglobus sp.]
MFAAVLAGGRGKRLGGVEKGLLKIGGRKIIEYILEALKDFDTVIVCRDEEQSDLYSKYSLTITDILEGMGPLGGIHAALMHFKKPVLVVSSDMPFLNSTVCKTLYMECENADAVIPKWPDGKLEPTLASYSTSLIPEIERCYETGKKKVLKAVEGLKRVKFYPIEELKKFDRELLTFMNINTSEDLKRAEEIRKKRNLGSV